VTQPDRAVDVTYAARPATATPVRTRRPPGTPGKLTDRVLVQTSTGQLDSVLPWLDDTVSGLVLGRGQMSNRKNLRALIQGLPDRGWDGPVVFDPEAYRHYTATTDTPFLLDTGGMVGETLTENLDSQRALGSDVALVPMGYVDVGQTDALKAGAAQASALTRDDTMFIAPLKIALLGRTYFTQVSSILTSIGLPVGLVLFGQFDPLDHDAKALVTNLRTLVSGPTHYAPLRTDFNGLDLIAHGAFSAAIGSGGSMRHATAPDERPRSYNAADESPSVLYGRLASWWRGSKIAREHGRVPAPRCECGPCDGQNIARFLSRDHSDDARAHAVTIWQRWARDLLGHRTHGGRADYWKNFCTAALNEHAMLATQIGRTKPFPPRSGLSAWAQLPA
jgi:hypothetical protein